MHRWLVAFVLASSATFAHASMTFYAVALPAGQAATFLSDPRRMIDALQRKDDTILKLDKSWQGLHYLMTGSAEQPKGVLGQAILGGREVGEDLGYGPARVLTPENVKKIAVALAQVTQASLAARYDPATMERLKIYPPIWTREGTEGLRFLQNYLPALKAFYQRAADSGSEVVLLLV